jgi:hypothetical protein
VDRRRPPSTRRPREPADRPADHSDGARHRVHFDGAAVGTPSHQVGESGDRRDTQFTAEDRRAAERPPSWSSRRRRWKDGVAGTRHRDRHHDVAGSTRLSASVPSVTTARPALTSVLTPMAGSDGLAAARRPERVLRRQQPGDVFGIGGRQGPGALNSSSELARCSAGTRWRTRRPRAPGPGRPVTGSGQSSARRGTAGAQDCSIQSAMCSVRGMTITASMPSLA